MKCLQGECDFSFQIGTVGLSHAAHLLRGNDTYCSVTSKPKRIWFFGFCFFFLSCLLIITRVSDCGFFFLLTYVFIIWDFIYGTVFLSTLQ